MRTQVGPGAEAAGEAAELSAEDLQRVGPVPTGAAALAGAAVFLLLLAWLLIYLAVYLPRGMVG